MTVAPLKNCWTRPSQRAASFAATAFCCALVACARVPDTHGPAPHDSAAHTPRTANGAATSPTTSTAGVLCALSASEDNADPSVMLTASFDWACTGSARVLSSNGVPNHAVGKFPGPGNPNPIGAVPTMASYTLTPALTGSITAVVTTGYALNGVKLEPATAGACDDSGRDCRMARSNQPWQMEALGQTAFNFGTDQNNGHVQPTGAYHYHGMPEALIARLGKGKHTMTLIAWATDGFPIYARYGHQKAGDASSPVAVMQPSYRLKTAPDSGRPAASMFAMGTFTQDYMYVAGSGDLDECNGRTGVTPEFPNGIYHYVITETFPFINRCVKGTAASRR